MALQALVTCLMRIGSHVSATRDRPLRKDKLTLHYARRTKERIVSCVVPGFSASMSGVYQATVFFSGRVQGVGFRYQALQVAKGYEVSGCVMNLPDGRVQLEAEGRADEVRDFIVALQERMEGYIRKVEQTETQRAPQYQGFTIR